jgi:hypothetical protein
MFAAMALARADDGPAGNWKVVLPGQIQDKPLWILQLANKDGKWSGKILAQEPELQARASVESVSVDNGLLDIKLKLNDAVTIRIQARQPKEKDAKVLASVAVQQTIGPAVLEPTTLTSLDPFEVNKELLSRQTAGHEVVQAALNLLRQAAAHKAKPEEVRAWADRAAKNAEPYGPLWHRKVVLDIAEALGGQDGFAATALQYARQAERLLEDKDSPATKKKVLTALGAALEKAGKTDEAKEVQARNDKIALVAVQPFAGRKGKSNRAILVELFTGAECPPCVASDLAFDALEKTYKPSEVVLLQYHLHIPGPDPLTNTDTESRQKFYGNSIRGTPTLIFNGKPGAQGGGSIDAAQPKYEQILGIIEPLLEKPAKATLKLSATRKGDKIDIKADVADLEETGPDVRLRLALVEDKVSYTGGNKQPQHHSVVRSMPGGPAGTVLKDKTLSKSVSVDLQELRKHLGDYLEKVASDPEQPIKWKDKPMELKKLRVVAFVQNDDTGEVIQAAQADVTDTE